jgi:lipopolysaccharide export system protein LptA
MGAFDHRFFWSLAALLLLVGGGGPASYGQARPDTARADRPIVAPPAPLDSVRTEDAAPSDTSAPEKAIVTADSLSAMTRTGERLQELFGNVRVRQDTTRLRSRYGLRYLNRDELLFTGDVVIYERGDTLRADTVWYNKRTKVGRARKNVRLTDGEVVVRAPKAIYYTEEKRSVFPDSVTLVDSSRVLRAQEGTYWSNDRRAEFSGAVQLTDPDTYLESDSLTYFRDRERSIATGSVFIRRVGAGEEDAATDTSSITYLFGDWADNQEQNRYSRVERQALLVRVRMDSTGAPEDTLAVRAHRLEAQRTDTYHRLVAVDSVRIWQADLSAVADSAVYDRVVEAGAPDTTATHAPLPDTRTDAPDTTETYDSPVDSLVARTGPLGPAAPDTADAPEAAPRPPSPPDTTRADTTTTDTTTTDTTAVDTSAVASQADPARPDTTRARTDTARAQTQTAPAGRATTAPSDTSAQRRAARWSTPSVQSDDDLPLEETRLFRSPVTWFERTQVWGDSIRVRARNRSLDTVYVRGSAFAAQLDTTVDRVRQLKGRDITAFFRRDSLRKILARPNGQAIYFSAAQDGTLSGATRASADVVEIRFAQGDVEQIKFGRGVQGTAYHKKEYIPDPFRLEGFQWTPDRRPTRTSLLRDERVRERLDLGPPTPRQAPRPPVAQAAPDSTAPRGTGPRRWGGTDAPQRLPPRSMQSSSGRGPAPVDPTGSPSDSLRVPQGATPPTAQSDTSDTPNANP